MRCRGHAGHLSVLGVFVKRRDLQKTGMGVLGLNPAVQDLAPLPFGHRTFHKANKGQTLTCKICRPVRADQPGMLHLS